jgi:tetratricopeptide (TPR) repeat protein
MRDEFRRVKELFLAALEREDPAGREAFLRQACGAEPPLRRQVEALLRRHEQTDNFLERPAVLPVPAAAEDAGSRIGPYQLLEQIGEGGMGAVWLAQQVEPVKRQVALKLIKPGMDSVRVIARFEAERQALALMDHPNVARVFDAGTTPGGRPYFVMELVKGVPITRFCDENQLTPRQRLELFVSVCQAVQHAHTKGIIHRDLKPSNVLVACCDGVPVVKVIDFGVAKAVGEPLTERTPCTGFGDIVGTFQYMSPEQAEFNALDVDTRSDIYSLGVVLYELLTGTTPLSRQRLEQTPLEEVLRLIHEEEPPRPSSRPGKEASAYQELDWIVLKCLEKERSLRYQTAGDLARDAQRYLHDEAVEAGPPGAGYRLRKFVRHHRRVLATASAFLVLLVAAVVVSVWQAVRARQAEGLARQNETQALAQKERAEEAEAQARTERDNAVTQKGRADEEAGIARTVNAFLLDDLLGQSDIANQPGGERNPSITVRELLDRAAQRIEGKFPRQERTEAAIQFTLGNAYRALGEYRDAQKHLERSLALYRHKLGPDHPATLLSMHGLAQVYEAQGRYDEAEDLCRRVLQGRRAQLGADHPQTLAILATLASLCQARGRFEEGERLGRQVLAGLRARLGSDHRDTLASMSTLGSFYQARGRHAEAQRLCEHVLERCRARLGADHPDTFGSLNNLAMVYQKSGRFQEAQCLLEQALERCRTKLGPAHHHTLLSMANLGLLRLYRGDHDQAERLCKQALEGYRARLGPDHPHTLANMLVLATVYQADGRYGKAEPLLVDALQRCRARLGNDHPRTLLGMGQLGMVYLQRGRHDEAQRLFQGVLAAYHSRREANNSTTLACLEGLGSVWESRGHIALAERLFKQVLERRRAEAGADHPETLISMSNLARFYRERGRPAEAESLLLKAVEGFRNRLGADHPRTILELNNLGTFQEDRGRFTEAQRLYQQALEASRARLGADHPHTLTSMNNLGNFYRSRGRYSQAEPLLVQALQGRRAKLGAHHPDTLVSLNSLGMLYFNRRRHIRAEPLLVEALQGRRARLGLDHPDTLGSMNNLAGVYQARGRHAEAERLFRQALRGYRARLGADHLLTLASMNNLGRLYQERGRYDEAQRLLHEVVAAARRTLRPADPHMQGFLGNLMFLYRQQADRYARMGQPARAEPLLRLVAGFIRDRAGPESPAYTGLLALLSINLLEQKKYVEAEATARDCLAIRVRQEPGVWTTANTRSVLGEALLGQKKYAQAERFLVRGYQDLKQREETIPAQVRQARLAEALERLVRLYDGWGKKDEAAKWRQERDRQNAAARKP